MLSKAELERLKDQLWTAGLEAQRLDALALRAGDSTLMAHTKAAWEALEAAERRIHSLSKQGSGALGG